jgi:HlyD family secretion protein
MKAGFKRYFVPASAAIGLLAVAWLAMTHGPMAMPVVKVAEAKSGDLHPAVFGIGTVEARLSYAIGPTQAGRVLSVQVDHGDSVKAGQVLAEIDPVDLDERIKSAGLAAQRARLNVESAEALTREAASRFKQAEANAQRYQDLVAKHFVSQEAAESRRNEADIARAALDASKSNLEAIRRDLAKAGSDRDGVARQRANLKLVSPTDGIVVAREAEPGNTVVAGQAVLRVMDPASLWVRARMDQSSSRGLQPGQDLGAAIRRLHPDSHRGKLGLAFFHPPHAGFALHPLDRCAWHEQRILQGSQFHGHLGQFADENLAGLLVESDIHQALLGQAVALYLNPYHPTFQRHILT